MAGERHRVARIVRRVVPSLDIRKAHAPDHTEPEQRKIGDEFRVVERSIQELHGMLEAKNVDAADRTEMELSVISRTDELMLLGKRRLELDAAVTVASLRPA